MAENNDYKEWWLEASKEAERYADFIDDLDVDGWDLHKMWEKKDKKWDELYEDYAKLSHAAFMCEPGDKFVVTMGENGKVKEARPYGKGPKKVNK